MADIKKIRLSGVTYNIVDESAIHSLDGYYTSAQTDNAITAATSALAQTIAEQGYQTSGDVQNAISGKADTTAVTQDIAAAVSGKANVSDAVTNVEFTKKSGENQLLYSLMKDGSWSAGAEVFTAGSGLKMSGKTVSVDFSTVAAQSDIPAVSGYADSVAYDTNSKYMKFYHGGTGGTEVFSFDASPFLIDGMIESVVITSITSGSSEVEVLQITWNSAAGGQVTNIPLSDIFDASNYYTTAQTNSAIEAATSGKADTTAVTQEISAAVSGKVDTSTFETYSGNVETALSGKQATLVSGTNIKTINNESILGSGNIEIEQGTVDQTIISGSTNAVAGGAVYDGLAGKQATLVSGTNIKTVGTNSLLGSGNIALMTASIGTGNDSETLIFDFA